MEVEIITPETTVFSSKDIVLVQLPGTDGSFEILQNHAPIIASLKKGKIKIIDQAKTTQFIEINGGVVEVLANKVLILAE
ncbi:MAG: ATP synthase F1 subunit epsilon [Bacteroidales bacterium]|nr:ATP synthase F1 subunit epsilon [Bacteroidales bacterium]